MKCLKVCYIIWNDVILKKSTFLKNFYNVLDLAVENVPAHNGSAYCTDAVPQKSFFLHVSVLKGLMMTLSYSSSTNDFKMASSHSRCAMGHPVMSLLDKITAIWVLWNRMCTQGAKDIFSDKNIHLKSYIS